MSMDVATLLTKMPHRVNEEGFYIPSPPFYQTQQQVFTFPESQTQLNPTASCQTPAFYSGPNQQYYNHSCYYGNPQTNQVQFVNRPQPGATQYTSYMPISAGSTPGLGTSPRASYSTIHATSPPSNSLLYSPEATAFSRESLSFTEGVDTLDSILGDDSGFYTSDSSYDDSYFDLTCLSPVTITMPDLPKLVTPTPIQIPSSANEKPKPTKSSRIKISKLKKGLSCGICLKRFQTREEYSAHVVTHKVKRSYPCDLCGVVFRQMSTMRTHRRTHTGETPYGCMVCDRRFSDHSALHKHKLVHSGERPYKCAVAGCASTFTQSGNLKRHMKNIHKL